MGFVTHRHSGRHTQQAVPEGTVIPPRVLLCVVAAAALYFALLCFVGTAFRHLEHGSDKVNANKTSGMVQSWNKFCFTGQTRFPIRFCTSDHCCDPVLTPCCHLFWHVRAVVFVCAKTFAGGLVEFSVKLPGDSKHSGFWAATWLMGNLGRAGYYPSLQGMWPFSYNACADGSKAHDWNNNVTQRISKCNSPEGALELSVSRMRVHGTRARMHCCTGLTLCTAGLKDSLCLALLRSMQIACV